MREGRCRALCTGMDFVKGANILRFELDSFLEVCPDVGVFWLERMSGDLLAEVTGVDGTDVGVDVVAISTFVSTLKFTLALPLLFIFAFLSGRSSMISFCFIRLTWRDWSVIAISVNITCFLCCSNQTTSSSNSFITLSQKLQLICWYVIYFLLTVLLLRIENFIL